MERKWPKQLSFEVNCLSYVHLWHKIIWGCPITLVLKGNSGIGGRLHYFVWEDYVFQTQPTVIIKGAWLVRLFCKNCRIYYRVWINRKKNNILPENIFLPPMWFKKCIVKKAGLCATRFQRFVGKILLCKLVANTHFGSQKMELHTSEY